MRTMSSSNPAGDRVIEIVQYFQWQQLHEQYQCTGLGQAVLTMTSLQIGCDSSVIHCKSEIRIQRLADLEVKG
jgi:hypothetical protein